MPDNLQNNILITRDGQACLGEFGITGVFWRSRFYDYELGTLRFTAPECCLWVTHDSPETNRRSKRSDVYSLAMTSFSVSPPVVIHPTT